MKDIVNVDGVEITCYPLALFDVFDNLIENNHVSKKAFFVCEFLRPVVIRNLGATRLHRYPTVVPRLN